MASWRSCFGSRRCTAPGIRPATTGTMQYFADLLGYRIKPGLAAGFDTVAALGIPLVRGAVIMVPTIPEIDHTRQQANPFGVPVGRTGRR